MNGTIPVIFRDYAPEEPYDCLVSLHFSGCTLSIASVETIEVALAERDDIESCVFVPTKANPTGFHLKVKHGAAVRANLEACNQICDLVYDQLEVYGFFILSHSAPGETYDMETESGKLYRWDKNEQHWAISELHPAQVPSAAE